MIRILLAIGLIAASIAAAHAFGFGLGNRFGKLGAFPNGGGASPPSACGSLALEDGSSVLLLEDGSSQLLLEGSCGSALLSAPGQPIYSANTTPILVQ